MIILKMVFDGTFRFLPDLTEFSSACLGEGLEITHQFSIPSCNTQQTFVCQEKTFVEYNKEITLVLSTQSKNDT